MAVHLFYYGTAYWVCVSTVSSLWDGPLRPFGLVGIGLVRTSAVRAELPLLRSRALLAGLATGPNSGLAGGESVVRAVLLRMLCDLLILVWLLREERGLWAKCSQLSITFWLPVMWTLMPCFAALW